MTDTISAFPLAWPLSWKRNHKMEKANFHTAFSRSMNSLLDELRLMGATGIIISSNIPVKKDGFPYSNQQRPSDPGIAVYFNKNGKQQCIPCDKWDRAEDNIHAIELTVRSLRGISRWGTHQIVDAAFRGFEALPYHSKGTPKIYYFSGLPREEAWRKKNLLKKELHPDMGGSHDEFTDMMDQWNEYEKQY